MTNNLLVSFIIGAVILLVLTTRDFKKKIFKPKNGGRYYTAWFLFSFINIFIYTSLCAIFLGIDPTSIFFMQTSEATKKFTELQLFQPILISLMYFGTGIAKFKFGEKNIDFYQILLNAFQDLIEITVIKEEEIKKKIAQVSAEYKTLKEKIYSWREDAKRKKWDKLENDWRDTETDINMLDEQATYLGEIDQKLNDPVNITYVKEDINKRIKETRETQVKKIKKYITKFILTNIKDENDIDFILKELGAKPSLGHVEPNPVLRCFILCITFGLLIGPIYGFFLKKSIVQYGWYGAASVGVFGLIFSYVRTAKKNVADILVRALLSGGIAGTAGHYVFMAARSLGETGELIVDYGKLYFGFEFGCALGLLIFVYRNFLLRIPVRLKYLLLSLSGGALFVVLGFLNDMHHAGNFAEIKISIFIGFMFFFGLVVTTGMAFGLNIFNEENN